MNTFGLNIIFRNGCFCGRETIRVKTKKYYIKEVIGEGGFSSVYLVEDSSTKKLYAVKKIICHSMDDQTVALNEVKVHNKVDHENVIKLVDYDIDGIPDPVLNATSQIYLLLPYYKRGTLHDELQKRSILKKPFEPSEVLEMFLKICNGVKAFHQLKEPLAHRDLKTANILLDTDFTPVIMDLGSATGARMDIKNLSDAQSLQDLAAERCSMPYRAPELFSVTPHTSVDERTDIWSLACILYAMCFFKSPFDAVYERGDSVALAVLSENLTYPERHIYGKEMEELIEFMFKVNPTERPFIDQVIEKVEETLRKYTTTV
ncbi:UNVERIFIED_CONTAM: hypothetical protein PYX00_010125 [Menopon gallinae]|uniref:non-specific serine/threonine protein kinase n=1 Tax=Menopon gallinae TaxID=328185 RepID=A0AAW2HE59_9NEOP